MVKLLFIFLCLLKLIISEELITIHVVPHSHDDVGWLKTMDEYFLGENQEVQNACVLRTISSSIDELLKDPTKHFIQVEMAFFRKWWDYVDENYKNKVRYLIDQGQFEFVNSGVCQNDEATPYYEDIIDNMSWGQLFINKHFGVKAQPTIGWQVDPFGHSQTMAALFSQMGFDGWFFGRQDYQDRDARNQDKRLEFIQLMPRNQSIFTHALFNQYQSPNNFCFEFSCADPKVTKQNVQQRSEELVNWFKNQRNYYQQNTLMHVFGGDFQYQQAGVFFDSLDQVMKYINANVDTYNVIMKYSTPSKYLKELNKLKLNYTVKSDDYFPYSDWDDSVWTGYFTSRPATKLFSKQTGRFIQAYRNLISNLDFNQKLTDIQQDQYFKNLDELEFYQGVLQHHDAVSGTAKQRVTWNYNFLLDSALQNSYQDLFQIVNAYNKANNVITQDFQICNWNQTQSDCKPLQNQNIIINVYNPGAQRNSTLRIKVDNNDHQVYDQNYQKLETDIICINSNDCELYFEANLQANQIHIFYLEKQENKNFVDQQNLESKTYMISPNSNLTFNDEQKQFQYKFNNFTTDFSLQYGYYESSQDDGQKSGAYNFKVKNNSINFIEYCECKSIKTIFVGKMVTVVHFQNDNITSTLRFYPRNGQEMRYYPEVESFVNGINVDDGQGKEIIILFNTNMKNNQTFYTDSNGLDLQKRILNYRPSWNVSIKQYLPQNYYPVNAMIGIEDDQKSFYVLNDRTQGGSSYREGQIELMIHRRLLKDDDKGVCENLNELDQDGQPLKVKTRHFVSQGCREMARNLQFLLDLQPIIILSQNLVPKDRNDQQIISDSQSDLFFDFAFPVQRKLKVYLKKLDDKKYLLRYHNMYENQELKLDLSKFRLTEMSITGVKTLDQIKKQRLVWQNYQFPIPDSDIIQPQQIRTFIVEL